MKKFPKLKYPNHEATDGLLEGPVVVTEKLDGANFRFTWDAVADTLVVGTRNHTYEVGDPNIPKAFSHAIDYVQAKLDEAKQSWLRGFETGNWAFYGEAMHQHSLNYSDIDWEQPHKGPPHVPHSSEHPNVVLFDVYDHDLDTWLPWDEASNVISSSPFFASPLVEDGHPEDLDFDIPDESYFGGQPEGIVIRRFDGSVRAKKVSDNFQENKGKKGSVDDISEAASNAAEFVAMYVTGPRIEKEAHKLVDEGQYDSLRMEMMEDLPRRVLTDAMAENGWDLLNNEFECQWDDDFKHEVRSKASKKCARELKNMMQDI